MISDFHAKIEHEQHLDGHKQEDATEEEDKEDDAVRENDDENGEDEENSETLDTSQVSEGLDVSQAELSPTGRTSTQLYMCDHCNTGFPFTEIYKNHMVSSFS